MTWRSQVQVVEGYILPFLRSHNMRVSCTESSIFIIYKSFRSITTCIFVINLQNVSCKYHLKGSQCMRVRLV
uniref:Uncharacterized protein n=1 Tax=Rhizophora mucronata TaxID=61149 RepID=A0A2P2IHI3_RHIMU